MTSGDLLKVIKDIPGGVKKCTLDQDSYNLALQLEKDGHLVEEENSDGYTRYVAVQGQSR